MQEPIIRTIPQQVADHFVASHASIGSMSMNGLAGFYGVKRSAVQQGIRIADARLAAQGLTVTVANRGAQWQISVTNDAMVFALSIRDRVTAIASELARYQTKLATCQIPDPALVRSFEDLTVELSSFLARTETLIAPTNPVP